MPAAFAGTRSRDPYSLGVIQNSLEFNLPPQVQHNLCADLVFGSPLYHLIHRQPYYAMLGRTSQSVIHKGLRQYTGRVYLKSTRHYSQKSLSNEAYLETYDSEPRIKYLSLNRPKSKNAISTRLLKVNRPAFE